MVLTLFSGCGSKPADDVKYFGDELTKDTLRICMDVDLGCIEITSGGQIDRAQIYKDFIQQINAVNFKSELDVHMQSALSDCYTDYFQYGEISREKVAEAYKNMQRMMSE